MVVTATFPFVMLLPRAVPGDGFTPAAQLSFWLPWQIAHNLRQGWGPFDGAQFPLLQGQSLLSVVGHPGLAPLRALPHFFLPPLVAHNLGLLLLGWTNVLGAWALGRRHGEGWAAAAGMAGAAVLWMNLAGGAFSSAWVGPALGALAAWDAGRPRWAWGLTVLGVLGAPLPTGLILCAMGRWAPGLIAVGLGALLPPTDATIPLDTLPTGAILWPAAGARAGLPLWTLLGVAVWWAERRWLAIGWAALYLILLGPVAVDLDGVPLRLLGHEVVLIPELLTLHARSVQSALVVVALFGVLRRLPTAPRLRLAALAWMIAEGQLQAAWGQPATLWTRRIFEAPEGLSSLSSRVDGPLLVVPCFSLSEGGVFWIPFHQMSTLCGPGVQRDGPMRDALITTMDQNSALRSLIELTEGQRGDAPALLPAIATLRTQGYQALVLVGRDPQTRLLLQTTLGRPSVTDPAVTIWELPANLPPPPP